jgi:hypothetical protein
VSEVACGERVDDDLLGFAWVFFFCFFFSFECCESLACLLVVGGQSYAAVGD